MPLKHMTTKQKLRICFIASAILAAGLFGWFISENRADDDMVVITPSPAISSETPSAAPEDTEPAKIMAHIFGAVANPGVYELLPGSRVYDLIEFAGGLTADAAPESVNQSAFVSDTDYIKVQTWDEWEEGGFVPLPPSQNVHISVPEPENAKININTAGKNELMTLPGIGEVTAGNIIDYRERNGAFRTIDEIKKVSRIGDTIFERIRELITVE
jgi:competence protein ComEA